MSRPRTMPPPFGPELVPYLPPPAATPDCYPFVANLLAAIRAPLHARCTDEREEYDDIRTAIYELRRILGMSPEQFAARLWMPANRLTSIEKRGTPIDIPMLERMKAMCWEHSLVRMWQYFDRQIVLLQAAQGPRQRKPKNRFDK